MTPTADVNIRQVCVFDAQGKHLVSYVQREAVCHRHFTRFVELHDINPVELTYLKQYIVGRALVEVWEGYNCACRTTKPASGMVSEYPRCPT